MLNGPFATQATNMNVISTDIVNFSFINTMNALNSQGKITMSVFKSCPSKGFELPIQSAIGPVITQ